MKEKINLFFACDDNYIPFLSVTINSLLENCDKSRDYQVYVLNNGIKQENAEKIKNAYNRKNFNINFYDVSEQLEEFNERLHTRDYYSKSTYYRLFIPTIFKNLDKALYLDSDIVLCGDVSKLYDVKLGSNLVGAVHDIFVDTLDVLGDYVENRIGVERKKYFNAGVLLMNLEELRKFKFKDKFLNLLSAVKFDIAQDQDYLNALCNGRTTLIDKSWNFMPLEKTKKDEKINLIHFNLDYKPWQKDGILYADLFWKNAEKTDFLSDIKAVKEKFDIARQSKAKAQTNNLVINAQLQANDKEENERIQKIINIIKGDLIWINKHSNHQRNLQFLTKSTNLNDLEYLIEMLKMTQQAKC